MKINEQTLVFLQTVNMSSPRNNLCPKKSPDVLKRKGIEHKSVDTKRAKVEKENDIISLKRKNFIAACEQVSFKRYCDIENRLQLIYSPTCLDPNKCCHQDNNQV